MIAKEKKEWACCQLRKKSNALGRLPKKDEFDETQRARIKAFLGPWPRALEAAGLKEPKASPPPSKKRKKTAAGGVDGPMPAKASRTEEKKP